MAKVALVLSGGGARGFAHIGVINVLAENDIPIDMVVGTSAGAFVGAAYAAGMSADDITAMSKKIGWRNMIRPTVSRLGILSNTPMGKFVEDNFPVRRFEELKLPFAATAFDLKKNELVIQQSGDLAFAVRASCAVPFVFTPLRDDAARLLADGGAASPMPVETAREMGADIVIGVDLIASGTSFKREPRTGLSIAVRSALSLLQKATAGQHALADIVIKPQIAHLHPTRIDKREEFIRLGEEAARKGIDKILELMKWP